MDYIKLILSSSYAIGWHLGNSFTFTIPYPVGWHLDHVEVWDDNTDRRYFFPCQRWFDKREDDGLIERILEVGSLFSTLLTHS